MTSSLKKVTTIGRRRGRKNQKGQTLVIFALMFVFLIGIVGLATDSAVAFAYSVSLERAASAAALAGAPYMPNYLGTAKTRALDEAQRNGWVDGAGSTKITVAASGTRQISVKITTTVPTFFMSALGIGAFPVTREAIAGYLPPIPLGQPGFQLGSTVSQLGGANQFYFMRFKAWNKIRSEGDPYTPNLRDSHNQTTPATDVHAISSLQGNESSIVNDPNDTSANPACGGALGALPLPCRGGQNYRVTIPTGTRGIIQIYNAAFAPEFGTLNKCENHIGLPIPSPGTAVPTFDTCSGTYDMKEGNGDGTGGNDPTPDNPTATGNGALLSDMHCGDGSANSFPNKCSDNAASSNPATPRQQLYNAVGYTVFAAPNVFVRSDDDLLSQTKILPIDATNWDGKALTGKIPSYVNVATGLSINQCYDAAGNPSNMNVYHAWTNIVTENGSGSPLCPDADSGGNSIVTHTQNNGTYADGTKYSDYVAADGSVGAGTYRVRVDSLKWDGSDGPAGDASKGYAIRVVDPASPNTGCTAPTVPPSASTIPCTVAGWEDMTLYSPIHGSGGQIPLFHLPTEYQGQTILVDAFDVGDAGGNLELSLIDPATGTTAKSGSCAAGAGSVSGGSGAHLNVVDLGINRFPPVVSHKGPQAPDVIIPGSPAGSPLAINAAGSGTFTKDQAGEESTTNGNANYQGTWVQFEIPICSNYTSAPSDYWNIDYTWNNDCVKNPGTCQTNDTFAFAVSTKGGPLHLISS